MLESISPSIWVADDQLTMPGKIIFPIRMTVIRLKNNRLALHSPIAITDSLADQLSALGEVAYLIGPNNLHHLYLQTAAERWPNAKIYAAPGLTKKQPTVVAQHILGDETAMPWQDEMEQIMVSGLPWASETVFYHIQDKVLVVTDLIFNMHEAANFRTRMLLKCVGAWQKAAQSRLLRMMVKDRQAAGAAARKILEWDIEKVVMAHGRILDKDAKPQLEHALKWMINL